MARVSSGVLLYRIRLGTAEVFLIHPGGPFWAKKDHGSWSIPKGEYQAGEDPLQCAIREFHEETGGQVEGGFRCLGGVLQSKKTVTAWAAEGDFDPRALKSNLCEIEWPPRSGRTQMIPEVDRAGWFSLEEARKKMLAAQLPFLDRLELALKLG